MSAVLTHPEMTPQRLDYLADDAVMIGPVSTSNSLLTGKITGNFVDFGLHLRLWRPVGEQIQALAAEFPTQGNREFFRWNRECYRGIREFHLPKPKSSPDEVFGTLKGANRIGASRLHHITNILQVPVAFFFEGAPANRKRTAMRPLRFSCNNGRTRAHKSIHANQAHQCLARPRKFPHNKFPVKDLQ
jgi:hypothetical protein